jgi:FRG domain
VLFWPSGIQRLAVIRIYIGIEFLRVPRKPLTVWSKLGVQRRPGSVSGLLGEVSNITIATGHRYVWRGLRDAHYTLHSSLERRLKASNIKRTAQSLADHENALLKKARELRLGDGRSDAELLAILQHAGASTPLLDVTPDPFVALFFATEPVGEQGPCALVAIKVPGDTLGEQAGHTYSGPLPDDPGVSIYDRLKVSLKLPAVHAAPILWEAPFVDNRMRAQRGMFLATTIGAGPKKFASFKLALDSPEDEKSHVKNLVERSRGNYKRPTVVVFYISEKMRGQVATELDRRFGYRTETIYPDLNGFALANASSRFLQP